MARAPVLNADASEHALRIAGDLNALIDLLAERLADRLAERVGNGDRLPLVYTPDTLARELGCTPRAIRAAIARAELAAVKRGGRWIILAESVVRWASPPGSAGSLAPTPRRNNRQPMREALNAVTEAA